MRTNPRGDRLRAARKRGTHTAEEWALLVLACGYHCLRCGAVGRVEQDHIIPVYQEESTDALENLQPICARCNASKGPESIDYRPPGLVHAVRNAIASGRIAEMLMHDAAEVSA